MTERPQRRVRVDDLYVVSGRGVVLTGDAENYELPPRVSTECWLEIDGARRDGLSIAAHEWARPSIINGRPNPNPNSGFFAVLIQPAGVLDRGDIVARDVWLVWEEPDV